jgi:hypothetical protein
VINGNIPAVAMAMTVMASADREIAVRHLDRTRYRIAEMSVPEWAIPTQKTNVPMYRPQPTGWETPATPMPLWICRDARTGATQGPGSPDDLKAGWRIARMTIH